MRQFIDYSGPDNWLSDGMDDVQRVTAFLSESKVYSACSYNRQVALNPTIDFIAGTVAVRLSSSQMSIPNPISTTLRIGYYRRSCCRVPFRFKTLLNVETIIKSYPTYTNSEGYISGSCRSQQISLDYTRYHVDCSRRAISSCWLIQGYNGPSCERFWFLDIL